MVNVLSATVLAKAQLIFETYNGCISDSKI